MYTVQCTVPTKQCIVNNNILRNKYNCKYTILPDYPVILCTNYTVNCTRCKIFIIYNVFASNTY